jgi:hypothetical protein
VRKELSHAASSFQLPASSEIVLLGAGRWELGASSVSFEF